MTTVCEKCNGAGRVQVNETTVRMCICAYAKDMRKHLGAEIADVAAPEDSPLFVPEPESERVDLTTENLHLQGYWSVILSHLKWALTFKGLGFKFKVVTDQQILDVWLGKDAYTTKTRATREDEVSYNTLADLLGRKYDLAIVHLGFLTSNNRAMPSVLQEALMVREAAYLPTWVVEETQKPFMQGHRAWSPAVAQYLQEKYQRVALAGGTAPVVSQPDDDASFDDTPAPVPYTPPINRQVFVNRHPIVTPDYLEDLGIAGGGGKKKKKSW